MPLPDPCAGWPAFNANLQGWGAQLLQLLAPVAITTWHDADPARKRFVGQAGSANNLNVAGSSSADVGVGLFPTGNVLASPPNLGAQLRWIRRGGAPGVAGLNIRGEIGLDRQLAPAPTATTQVLVFELLSAPGAGQPEQVSLGAEVTTRPARTTIELNLSVVAAPGPIRVRVGLASGTPVSANATNTAPGGPATRATGFLDDGGTASVFAAPATDGLGVELLVSPTAGGAIAQLSQLKVQIELPVAGVAGAPAGPEITVTGGAGFDLAARVLVDAPAAGGIDATVTLGGLPARVNAALETPAGGPTTLAWSTGTTQAPRSARLPTLEAKVAITPPAGDPISGLARLTDVPPGVDATIDPAGSFSLQGNTGTALSPIGAIRAELLSGFQVPPALTDFVWLDLPGESAAAELRDVQQVDVAWPSGAPIVAAVKFAARHPLSGFITAPAIRGNATIEDVPRDVTISIDVANAAVGWTGSDPISSLSADLTLVTTDAATGAGSSVIRVAGQLDDVPTGFDLEFAADRVKLDFDPAAPSQVRATVQLADAAGWTPGDPPPVTPAFDRTVEAEAQGLPDEFELKVAPSFEALPTGAALEWKASGTLDYVVAQLDGFELGPLRSLRARGGELPTELKVEYGLTPLVIDVDAPSGIGALHVLASDTAVTPTGAAPRRLDADIDLRGGAIDINATVRGLDTLHAELPIGGGPNAINVRADFEAPGEFPGGFAPVGPELRGWIRTDDLDVHADAATFDTGVRLQVDLSTYRVDARAAMTELDVDASGRIDLLGRSFDFDADLRTPAIPARILVEPAWDAAGQLTAIEYTGSAVIDDLLVDVEATPAPILGLQHARATLDVPRRISIGIAAPSLDIPDGIAGKVRVRSSRAVPLPDTVRAGQVVRAITVPVPPDPASLSLGSFGFFEAAVAKIEALRGFTLVGTDGTTALRGPRIRLVGGGSDQRIFASLQRRLGPNRLLTLARASLSILRPPRIDLRLTPGPMGEVGVRFPQPLRPVGGAATLGTFTARLEPAYVNPPGTPAGAPPVGERDPAFVVPGVTTAGIGAVSGTIVAVPSHLEFAITSLGPFGTVGTPLTITNPINATTLGIPAGWGGMRVDLILNGNLALRSLSATLYSLDWRRRQRWQRITASRIDVQPTGRNAVGTTASDRTITLHQFGLDPTVANGGSGGLGIALSVPTNAPINVAAVITSAEFARPPAAVPLAAPTGFASPTQVDVGNFSGFLGLRVDPIFGTPLIPTERDATTAPPTEWRVVATTPVGPVFLGNTGPVPLAVLAQIGLAVAAALVGGLIAGPWGAVAGIGLVTFEAQYFTALNAPTLAALPSATT